MSRPYRHKQHDNDGGWEWHEKAACRPIEKTGADGELDYEYATALFYSERDRGPARELRVMEAKAVCWSVCVVREECLAYAIVTRQVDGIWGGYEARELIAIRRARREAS